MSALNETLTEREVQHEWALHSRQWETEHMEDDDVQRLRAETSRMPRQTVTSILDNIGFFRTPDHFAPYGADYYGWDDCDQEGDQ